MTNNHANTMSYRSIALLIGIPFVAVMILVVMETSKFPPLDSELSPLESINKFLSDWIGLLVAIIGGVLSVISFFYNRKRDKLNGLSEALKTLNDNLHREARRVVHTHWVTPATRNILGFDNVTESHEVIRVCRDIVATDMDQIGTMAKNKLFDEKIYHLGDHPYRFICIRLFHSI